MGKSEGAQARSAPAPSTGSGWIVHRRARPGQEAHDETIFALSDGTLGVRASLEECSSHSGGAYLADAYERRPLDYHERVPGFARLTDTRMPVADGKSVRVRLGEGRRDLAEGRALNTDRTLDLATGKLTRTTDWRGPDGDRLQVTAERVACFRRPGLFPLRFTLRSEDYTGAVALCGAIETEGWATAKSDDPRIGVGAPGLTLIGWRERDGVAIAVQAMPSRGLVVLCGQAMAQANSAPAGRPSELVVAGRLEPGEKAILEKVVGYEICASNEGAIDRAAQALGVR